MEDLTHNLEGVSNDANSHQLLSVVASIHHQGVSETLDDGALCLAEPLLCVSTGRVGDIDRSSDLDVIAVKVTVLAHEALPVALLNLRFVSQYIQQHLKIGFLTSKRYRGSQRPRRT